jgi:amidase
MLNADQTALLSLGAEALAARIARREVGAREAVEASLAAIGHLDGDLRAFITVDAEGGLKAADAADKRIGAGGEAMPPLLGVPVAVKDVTPTAGLKTTWGSRVFADHVPTKDALSVARLRAAGAIVVGKTNTPEFAFGALCTNALCGPTATPWDLTRTSGGSSGGSAASVAAGLVPLAMGTDFGGSVRTPSSFCGCLALRPTPGSIPEPDRGLGWSTLATQGIMARSATDLALTLSVVGGPDPRDPTSLVPPARTAVPASLRLAASTTLGGAFPVDPDVEAAFGEASRIAVDILGTVRDAAPDVSGAADAFKTLRAAESWHKFGAMVDAHEDKLTPSFVWNVRRGRDIPARDCLAAEAVRTRTYRAFLDFFTDFDILLLPAASILPFPNTQPEVMVVGGRQMETIIDYLAPTFLVSLVGFPVVSFPILVTAGGLPFGIQMVARPHHEHLLIEAARRLEAAGLGHRWAPHSINGL